MIYKFRISMFYVLNPPQYSFSILLFLLLYYDKLIDCPQLERSCFLKCSMKKCYLTYDLLDTNFPWGAFRFWNWGRCVCGCVCGGVIWSEWEWEEKLMTPWGGRREGGGGRQAPISVLQGWMKWHVTACSKPKADEEPVCSVVSSTSGRAVIAPVMTSHGTMEGMGQKRSQRGESERGVREMKRREQDEEWSRWGMSMLAC